MGKATEQAHEQLHMTSQKDDMVGVVLVKTPGKANIAKRAEFVYKKGDHIELSMMHWLATQFPNYDVPDHSTIVFACNWSPCKDCAEQLIPGWLEKHLKLGERPLRVKYRFKRYYSKEEYKGDGSVIRVWEYNNEAQDKYNELSAQYGIYGKRDEYSEAAEGMTKVTEYLKPKLVFQRLGTGKTSIMGESFEGMLI